MTASDLPPIGDGPFKELLGQDGVKRYLTAVTQNGLATQSFLFVGPLGSGKTDAALAFASALMCKQGGCGKCDTCMRIKRRSHPDVRLYEPDGAHGYMVEQIREIAYDTTLAPVRGPKKIYILNRVDRLGTSAANAFLKTLEEPPADVVFVLLGRTREQVLPTIVSRCQVVFFRRIPAGEATTTLVQKTGCSTEQAHRALAACGGSIAKARAFLLTPSKREVRHKVLNVLDQLADLDDIGVMSAARDLLEAVQVPLASFREEQERQLAQSEDYLSRSAMKTLAGRQKRELSQRERDGIVELADITRSWLRDILIISSGAADALVVNGDHDAGLGRQARHSTPGAAARAVGAVDKALERISSNVTSQLAIEAMLFEIREVLAWPR